MPREVPSWRIRDYGDEGALSPDQQAALADKFNLDPAAIRKLSSDLAHALHPFTITGSIVDWCKSFQKGSQKLDSVISDLRMAEHRLARAADALSKLRVCYPETDIRPEDPNVMHRGMVDDALWRINLLRSSYECSAKKYRVQTLDAPDKRRIRDERRGFVLALIFQFWSDQGRALGFTTDSVTSERRGPLFDFTNAVVSFVTDPSRILPGQTIWTELDAWKDFDALRKSVSIDDLIPDRNT